MTPRACQRKRQKRGCIFQTFCNAFFECRDEADEQQIQKKKHVGNDHVSVIWSEHNAEYDPEVIKSQFNFVHVIIYPLQNGLYRIQIKKKDQIPSFGPLVDGALVSPQLLPLLVMIRRVFVFVFYRKNRFARP